MLHMKMEGTHAKPLVLKGGDAAPIPIGIDITPALAAKLHAENILNLVIYAIDPSGHILIKRVALATIRPTHKLDGSDYGLQNNIARGYIGPVVKLF